jgi:signal peptidase I
MKTRHAIALATITITALVSFAWIRYAVTEPETYAELWDADVVIAHTGSMEPTLTGGDIVTISPLPWESLKVGMIVVRTHPTKPDSYLAHRLIAFDGRVGATKGDANTIPDPAGMYRRDYRGVITHLYGTKPLAAVTE